MTAWQFLLTVLQLDSSTHHDPAKDFDMTSMAGNGENVPHAEFQVWCKTHLVTESPQWTTECDNAAVDVQPTITGNLMWNGKNVLMDTQRVEDQKMPLERHTDGGE